MISFQGMQLPKAWSSTTLILIPKENSASRIDHLRPISHCNVCHKIIVRIRGNRPGEVLPNLISPEQAGFVKGRSIHENMALAHDLTHDLDKQGSIKLDMSKAYDRISLTFLIRIMRAFGFKERWCDLIFRCISNNWYTVCLEYQQFDFFKSRCDVRQGDSLSPSLFFLAME